MSKTIKLEIVATGHRLNEDDSLFVVVEPQWADMAQMIFDELKRLTGHERHTVIPIPKDQIKIFSIKHPITVQAIQELKGHPVFNEVTEGEQTNE